MKKILFMGLLVLSSVILSGCFLVDKANDNQHEFEENHDEIFNVNEK